MNCTVVGNESTRYYSEAGGVAGCSVYGSIVVSNSASAGPNYKNNATFAASCTAPLPPGIGNLDAGPRFVDFAGGDFRLAADSPCVDRGGSLYVQGWTDLRGLRESRTAPATWAPMSSRATPPGRPPLRTA